MLAFPQPRYRAYGSARKYLDFLFGIFEREVSRDDAISRLEAAIARFIGVKYAIAMPQARVALYCALRSIIKDRRKVIMSPYTIYDIVNMVVSAGGKPIFADVKRETWNVDAEQIEQLIDDETGAVLITHLHGLACDVERISRLCKARDIPLIEDCAQAFGANVGLRRVGAFGTFGVFSF